jgi:hypothetical protein
LNRFKIRLAVAGVVAAAVSGCSAGQISQTAVQEPAVNGNKVTVNNVALRDIRMQAVQTGDFLQPGRAVDLVLVAVNQSPDLPDRLLGISTDIGNVMLVGDARPGCCSSARRTARTWRRARCRPTRRQRRPSS